MNRAASIDIGSNTIRLLIAEKTSNGEFRELESIRAITRLGEGMNTEKYLRTNRMDATIEKLKSFKKKLMAYEPLPLLAVATSAVREAKNQDEFIAKAKNAGIEVCVISWKEEAQLTLDGVFWKIPDEGKDTLTFDIGGGSTEFILSRGKEVKQSFGSSLGVVRLTERFISRSPTDPKEYSALTDFLEQELAAIREQLNTFTPERVIGTAGTVTTLAAIDKNIFPYDPEKIHRAIIKQERINAIQEDLMRKTLEERLGLAALEKGREDLIIVGTAIVLATLKAFACSQLTVSEYSLREGLLLKAFAEKTS
ncbi:MAG: exopolyphosphatase [Nitrospinae bacterium CG11_big_fil_rev_8_21_14_0_20_45_15]|nr:MAG: exopolyphosphatase [Nitrospinae bacterium CG11_big_fil_rev_8_21_14_0_20_45_15]